MPWQNYEVADITLNIELTDVPFLPQCTSSCSGSVFPPVLFVIQQALT